MYAVQWVRADLAPAILVGDLESVWYTGMAKRPDTARRSPPTPSPSRPSWERRPVAPTHPPKGVPAVTSIYAQPDEITHVYVPITGRGYSWRTRPRTSEDGSATISGHGTGYGDVREFIAEVRANAHRPSGSGYHARYFAADAVLIDYSVRADQPDWHDNPFTTPLSDIA